MVLKQIQDLLHSHDCVIIPDFGGLIAQYASSKIHPVKHTFTPPSKKIAFNEKLKQNDGLLISSLARHLRIESEEARQMVSQFVGGLQSDLEQTQRCELQGIGIFRYNAERKLEFEYLEAENYLSHSFGLPELEARPIIPQEAAVLRTVRQKAKQKTEQAGSSRVSRTSRKLATAAGTVLAGGLTVALVYVVSLQTDYNLSSLNPVTLFSSNSEKPVQSAETVAFSAEKVNAEAKADLYELPVTPEEESVFAVEADLDVFEMSNEEITLEEVSSQPGNATETAAKTAPVSPAPETKAEPAAKAVAETKVAKTPAVVAIKEAKTTEVKTLSKTAEKPVSKLEKLAKSLTKANTIKAATGRYFVISGGYSSMENARRSQIDLASRGADSEVIMPMAGSRLHRVSVAEFETMEMASAKLPELRRKYGNSLWILNY